jgi:hypothetical protein
MRKIVLAAVAAGAALALSSCGNAKKLVEEKPEAPVVAASLSAADKAAIDALGGDVEKLRAEVHTHSGTERGRYAFKKMNEEMLPKKAE